MKRPAFQFYPGDWFRDAGLRSCSIGARGLWIDLMCVMHDGQPYGHLSVNGKQLTDEQTARIVGVPLAVFRRHLAEIEGAAVSGRTPHGVLFSRRMVRDEEIREKRAAGGEKSADNPAVPRAKGRGKGPVEGYPYPPSSPPSLPPSPAVASAVAVASAEIPTPPPPQRTRAFAVAVAAVLAVLPEDAKPYFERYSRAARYPDAVVAEVWRALNPEHNPHYPPEIVGTALRQMQAKNADFSGPRLARWCANLLKPEPVTTAPSGDDFAALAAAERRTSGGVPCPD